MFSRFLLPNWAGHGTKKNPALSRAPKKERTLQPECEHDGGREERAAAKPSCPPVVNMVHST